LRTKLLDLAEKRDWADKQANKYWAKEKEYEAKGRME